MSRLRTAFSALLLSLLLSLPLCAQNIADDLQRLDSALGVADEFAANTEMKIRTLQEMINGKGLSPEQLYGLYGQLYQESVAYQFDTAMAALEGQLEVSAGMDDCSLYNIALVNKAKLFCTAGMYLESMQVSTQIDTTCFSHEQMLEYCFYMQYFYNDFAEYSQLQEEKAAFRETAAYYTRKFIGESPEEDFRRRRVMIQGLLGAQLPQQADSLSRVVMEGLDPSCHDYAIAAYYRAIGCRDMGRQEESLHWFIESAIADIRSAIKDNASLFTISGILLENHQDIERAFAYAQISLEDAVFFNAKLRPWQIAQSLPALEKAYLDAVADHERSNRRMLLVTSMLVILLLAACIALATVLVRQSRDKLKMEQMNSQIQSYYDSLTEANKQLQTAFGDLSEANRVKEEYIGLFLTMCSSYIDKLKKHLTLEQTDAELKAFYKTFDNAFLQLYPNFVDDFNALLKPEARIELKKDELLNTELRIFALIKLGITQSSHIASLLRYSVNTIYNYRAQIKNAALDDRENFEEMMKKIGN